MFSLGVSLGVLSWCFLSMSLLVFSLDVFSRCFSRCSLSVSLSQCSLCSIPSSSTQDTVLSITVTNPTASQTAPTVQVSIVTGTNVAIAASALVGSRLGAATPRPTLGSMSPNRVYKASATTIRFSTGAGTFSAGDKVSIRDDCANPSSVADGACL